MSLNLQQRKQRHKDPARESEANNGQKASFLEGSEPSCMEKHIFVCLAYLEREEEGEKLRVP